MKALIFSTSAGDSLPVKSGMPFGPSCGDSTNLSRLAIVAYVE
jgi:hypothetical protein